MCTDDPMNRVYLEIPGRSESLALVRLMVRHLAHTTGFDDDQADKVAISVDEACSNVIEHAYEEMNPKPQIHLTFHLYQNRFVIEIVDSGKTFDFSSYRPPSFPQHWQEGHTRGVGLYLITQCMDEVAYNRLDDARNVLRMTKHIGDG